MHSLENFIDTNLTLRLEQLEAEAGHSFKDPAPSNIEYINKTVSYLCFLRKLFVWILDVKLNVYTWKYQGKLLIIK